MIKLSLPFPVPLSACFKDVVITSKKTGQTFRTRAPTSRYKDWQTEALWMIKSQRQGSIAGLVSVYVRLVAPDKRRRDAGNMDKGLGDILVKAGVIEDDSNRFIRRLTYEWVDAGPPCVILIQPMQVEMAA